MSFPANAIGYGAAVAGGVYLGYQYDEFGSLSTLQLIIGLGLLLIGFYFAVILS